MSLKFKRLLFLLVYFIIACAFVLWMKPIYFVSLLIVLVPPSFFNFIWLRHSKVKIFLFSIITTLLFAFPIELVMRLGDTWNVQMLFPPIFGLIDYENILFAFINFFWGVSFYEYFVDRDRKEKISKRFKYLVGLYIILTVVVSGVYFYNMDMLKISYAMMAVVILIIPSIIIYFKNPRLLPKVILPTLFFAFIFFSYEIVSLIIGSWWWPGSYIYEIHIFGKLLPLDDIIIWYFLSTITLIGGYEFFVDNNK